jgi:ABC-type transporter Mla maintaining outer membrane lipid asymmetry ATPase subunit MlaF
VTAVLELDDVSKDYRGLRPLRIARLDIGSGESVALIGLDQIAAEVFVNLVTGATLPDRGAINLFGRPTSSISDSADWLAVVDRFGIVSRRAVLLDGLTVLQNLAMPFTLEVEPPPADVRERAMTIAHQVGLTDDVLPQHVGALDEGARARVRLGRALALDPAIVLLEHPTAELAGTDVAGFARVVRGAAAARGAALLALTADRDFARAVADRVLTLDPATGKLNERRKWWGRGSRA